MKTLHEILAIRNKRSGYHYYWHHQSTAQNYMRIAGKPTAMVQAKSGAYYFVWHKSCYIGTTAYTRPVHCPKRRRPLHASEPHACICLYENFGTKHHAFKKHSARVLRRAFKRDDLRELEEYYDTHHSL